MITLTDDQRYILTHALQTAATKFDDNAAVIRDTKEVVEERDARQFADDIADQLDIQARAVRELCALIESAVSVLVDAGTEVRNGEKS